MARVQEDVTSHPLDRIQVARPCAASWDSMKGDDRVRHCSVCRLNVYNLSGMTRREATDLISTVEGRLCVRFYRRKDGTILTRDCPKGWKTSFLVRVAAAVAAFMVPILGIPIALNWRDFKQSFNKWVDSHSPFQVMGGIRLPSGRYSPPDIQDIEGDPADTPP